MSALLDWAAALGGPGGIAVGVFGEKLSRRRKDKRDLEVSEATEHKLDAEAAQYFVQSAVKLVAPLEAQIKVLTAKVDAYTEYIQQLHIWIGQHTREVPPPPPIVGIDGVRFL